MEHSINWVAVIVIGVGATAVLDSWSLDKLDAKWSI